MGVEGERGGGGEDEEREGGYFLREDERSNSPRLQCVFPPGMPLSSSSTAISLPPPLFPEGMFGCQFLGLQPEATGKRYILCLTLVLVNS